MLIYDNWCCHSCWTNFYNDIQSLLIVVGGAFGYSLLKIKNLYIVNFGEGAIYFAWLRNFDPIDSINWRKMGQLGDVEKMGPALSIMMLTLFYGYTIKIITLAF